MIILGREHLRQIADAAEAAYPRECCGLLAGKPRPNGDIEVVRVHPSANLGKRPDRFEIDPRLWVDLSRAHGKGPVRVVGLYHSHPDRPAQPSATDLEAAWGEDLVWIIVSVAGPGDAQSGEPQSGEPQSGEPAPRAQAVHVTAHLLDHGGRQFRAVELRTDDWQPYPTRDMASPSA
jgi:proteasome lid subunit RPN8/RPN11